MTLADLDDDGVCPGCGGTDGACSCFDEDNSSVFSHWYDDCHYHNGSCGKAGSEECDWECPNSRLIRGSSRPPRPLEGEK